MLYNRNDAPVGGNPFLVKHSELPLLYYYTHLSGLARAFEIGDVIEKGEVLGYASNRGSSGGWYHLHFSLILIDEGVHVNPFPFLAEWYRASMPYYLDFLTDFDVYEGADRSGEVERAIVAGRASGGRPFHNSLPGIVHLREATAEAPFAGLNHIGFGRKAIVTAMFTAPEAMEGELWLGHTGRARLYLNGEAVYAGGSLTAYHRSVQPMQADAQMIPCRFKEGENRVVLAVEQTDVFWQFSLRPRTRLGLPLPR